MARRLPIALGASVVLHLGVLALVHGSAHPSPPAHPLPAFALELDVVRAPKDRLVGGAAPRSSSPGDEAQPPSPWTLPRARPAPPRAVADARPVALPPATPAPASRPPAAPAKPAAAQREIGQDGAAVLVAARKGSASPDIASVVDGARGTEEGDALFGVITSGAGTGAGGGGSGPGTGFGSGSGDGEGGERGRRLAEISRRLAAEATGCYPRAARRFRLEGRAKVRFCIGAQGEPQEARVLESSGHSLLDQAALCVVARAAPFPAVEDCPAVPINFVMAH